jgi:hypothetical protein
MALLLPCLSVYSIISNLKSNTQLEYSIHWRISQKEVTFAQVPVFCPQPTQTKTEYEYWINNRCTACTAGNVWIPSSYPAYGVSWWLCDCSIVCAWWVHELNFVERLQS